MAHQGGFAGRQMSAKDGWEWMRFGTFMVISAMIGNKLFQGNIWGIANKDGEGIVPIERLIGKPTDKFVDTYIKTSLDTSGFVDDDPIELARQRRRQQEAAAAKAGASMRK